MIPIEIGRFYKKFTAEEALNLGIVPEQINRDSQVLMGGGGADSAENRALNAFFNSLNCAHLGKDQKYLQPVAASSNFPATGGSEIKEGEINNVFAAPENVISEAKNLLEGLTPLYDRLLHSLSNP